MAPRYVRPHARGAAWALGVLLGIGLLLWTGFDHFFGRGSFLSSGPLSSSHAFLERERDCGACHAPGGTVADARCQECHERTGSEPGLFAYASHAAYRSGDASRAAAPRVPAHESLACASCHAEHGGREAGLVPLATQVCAGCHGFDSLATHPEFEFARLDAREAPGLHDFSHLAHVRQLLSDRGLEDVEQACLACHEPEAAGRGFAPLRFERHCSGCHLQPDVKLEAPLRSAGNPIGVESFEAIRQRRPAGSAWVQRMHPGEFRSDAGVVVKKPVHHADPWVLHNLRELRALLYEPGLADLLDAAPGAPRDPRALRGEALAALSEQLDGLRAVPDRHLQREIAELALRLAQLERGASAAPASLADFEPAPRPSHGDEARVEAVESVAAALGAPCFSCHDSDSVAIAAVQSKQRSLWRAEFDHSAHWLQRRCLDCHSRIPIPADAADDSEVDTALDRPEILNLPGIDTCRSCHQSELVSDACSTCHAYHPSLDHWGDLRIAVQPERILEAGP